MKPLILIFSNLDDEGVTSLQPSYISSIINAGGIPLIAPHTNDIEIIKEYVKISDGFMFSGGVDIDPISYNEEPLNDSVKILKQRDEFEFNALKVVFETGKPIIGICRGCQLINVFLGGALYQDICTQLNTEISHRQTQPKNEFSHSVSVVENTPLYYLCNKTNIKVNSFHHQCIKKLGDGLTVMATADDGVIEALYSTKHNYLRLYQWHPERLSNIDELNQNIFVDFVNHCK